MLGFLRNRPGRLEYVLPPREASALSRQVAAVDRNVATEVRAIDQTLASWAGHPKTAAVDQLLDERLWHRPPDVLASRRPEPVLDRVDNYWENP